MKKLMPILSIAMLAACGGTGEELGSTEQAVTGAGGAEREVCIFYNNDYTIGTGLVFNSDEDVLYNAWHEKEGIPHWQTVRYCGIGDPSAGGYWRYVSWGGCTEMPNPVSGVPNVWKICPTSEGTGSTDYYTGGFTVRTPSASNTDISGGGNRCEAGGSMSTDPAKWYLLDSNWWNRATRTGPIINPRNTGSSFYCAGLALQRGWSPTLGQHCYDYDTGRTCMWGDFSSFQARYGYQLIGLGFGNVVAAWADSGVMSWLSNQY